LNQGWIGRRIASAAPALAERFVQETPGPHESALAGLAGAFLRELGAGVADGCRDPWRPFRRTRGVLRLPPDEGAVTALREIPRLGRLVRSFAAQLPGATAEVDRYLAAAVQSALRAAATIHSALAAGMRSDWERAFGGVVVLEYRAGRQAIRPWYEDRPFP